MAGLESDGTRFFAGVQIVAGDEFVVVALLERDGAVTYDGETGIAQADGLLPEEFGGMRIPIGRQLHVGDVGIAIGAEKAGKIVAGRGLGSLPLA